MFRCLEFIQYNFIQFIYEWLNPTNLKYVSSQLKANIYFTNFRANKFNLIWSN